MNSRLRLSATCCALLLTASLAVGAPRGGGRGGGYGGHFSGMSARSGHSFSRGGMGIAGGRQWSGRNWSGRNWSGRNWSGRNWSGRNWNGRNWRGRNWNGNWRHHHDDNDVIFIGSFGFPSWGWGWGYPYGYYGYGYPYGYGYGYNGYGYNYGQSGYGYGYGSHGSRSRVAELQRRLARAGYYGGSIDGIMGPQTRRAIRAYERDRGYAG
jgi:Putative peptidoglycan binding domain